MASDSDDTRQRLQQAIEHHRQALEELQEALLAELDTYKHEEDGHHPSQLLSIKEVCEELGMGKSWVYQRLRSQEIPSIRLGGAIKVKREDLNAFIENQPYRSFERE